MPRLPRLLPLVLLTLLPIPARAQPADEPGDLKLEKYSTRSYVLHTNLPKDEAREFGRHMDLVFAEYSRRFSEFRAPRRRGPMDLYLFQTQPQYVAFMAEHDINASNSGGMFFWRANLAGLATWAHDRPRRQTLSVLQHEGFHQFAFQYIGPDLPVWVDEGIAQYFEDGILVKSKIKMGLANADRVEAVRSAITRNKAYDFDALLAISREQWRDTLTGNVDQAAMLYDQSWSILYFLIQADNGKYRPALEKYLRDVSHGVPSTQAFRKHFGNDTAPFRKRWEAFALAQQPDELTAAIERMEFLAQGLLYFHQEKQPPPKTIAELRRRLRAVHFRAIRQRRGGNTQISAMDDAVYRFKSNAASAPGTPTLGTPGTPGTPGSALATASASEYKPGEFRVLEPSVPGLPARLTAPGLQPEPVILWTRNPDDGSLTQEIEFR